MQPQFKFTGSLSTEQVTAITDRIEAANERVLDVVVDANRRLADLAVTSAARVTAALPVDVPFADKLPTATESAGQYLDFVERAVAMNREFSQRVLATLTANAPSDTVTAAKVSVETVPAKPAAKKATARKATAKKAPAKKVAAKKVAAKKSATTTSTTSN